MRATPARAAALVAALLLPLMVAACGGDPEEPGRGTLEVQIDAYGEGQDANGIVLLVDGKPAGTVAASGGTIVLLVASGAHSVLLTDVAANCVVTSGDFVRWVNVPRDGTGEVQLNVTCS